MCSAWLAKTETRVNSYVNQYIQQRQQVQRCIPGRMGCRVRPLGPPGPRWRGCNDRSHQARRPPARAGRKPKSKSGELMKTRATQGGRRRLGRRAADRCGIACASWWRRRPPRCASSKATSSGSCTTAASPGAVRLGFWRESACYLVVSRHFLGVIAKDQGDNE